ncbi:Cysteinyl-tRNA synthetase [Spironucleus salmonicida]|uniref:cysteine--tRNA ligase n=1 Tax=Spironucleus salmonicida TaxID=348837 RepID=V6LT32_9EUKA|nr:Cysteinyl-tRNA synthetase [Spironucleus salmonicida]|eukprot:EST47807.1 Cysteinyl-tRNA synthetase [Spironucleus salmonicida]
MYKNNLFNTQTAIPEQDLLRVYICGPTVYNSSHLGHARTYITFDIIRNILAKVFNKTVIYQLNITDIDDKIINRSNEMKIPFTDLVKQNEDAFFKDLQDLNINPPSVITRVTEFVPEIIEFIKKIIDNNFAYQSNGSVYFDVQAFQAAGFTYPKLRIFDNSNQVEANNAADGASMKNRTEEKRSPFDFALWKAAKPDEPFWESEFGRGRPGWHIECSVMSQQVLLNKFDGFDLHLGGKDLQFPHHANEIAQLEAFLGKEVLDTQFCGNCIQGFMHSGHLRIENEIMSKSKMNFKTIQDVLENYSANQIRILFLHVPYASDINYTLVQLDNAVSIESKIRSFFQNVQVFKQSQKGYAQMKGSDYELLKQLIAVKSSVLSAFKADFDYPSVLKQLLQFLDTIKQYLHGTPHILPLSQSVEFLKANFEILGLKIENQGQNDQFEIVRVLAKFRQDVKAQSLQNGQILALCDDLRDNQLPNLGFLIEDAAEITIKQIDASQYKVDRQRELLEKQAKTDRQNEFNRQKQLKLDAERLLAAEKAEEMFKNDESYGDFDERGIPQKVNGEEIAKSRGKKLVKEWEARKKLNEKYFGKE